jgi:hypothetical protein
MTSPERMLDNTAISVPRINLILKCRRFLKDHGLPNNPITSGPASPVLSEFCKAIQSELSVVLCENADDLAFLSTEFGFEDLGDAIARFASGEYDKGATGPRSRERPDSFGGT